MGISYSQASKPLSSSILSGQYEVIQLLTDYEISGLVLNHRLSKEKDETENFQLHDTAFYGQLKVSSTQLQPVLF